MARTLEERINGPEPVIFEFNEDGDWVLGELEEISERDGDFGPYRVITLFTDQGDVVNVAGFGTVLKGKFATLTNDDLGCKVAVKFCGEKKSKAGKEYKDWQMTVDRKVAAVAPGGFDTSEDI